MISLRQAGCGLAISRVEHVEEVDGQRRATVHVGGRALQLAGDLELFLAGHRAPRRLLAVAQRRIEDADVLGGNRYVSCVG